MKKMTILLSIILLSSVSLIAQNSSKDISDSELANFAEAYKEVQSISQESQQKMVKVIQDEGLNVQRFNTIMKAQQKGDQDLEVSDGELKKIETITVQLKEIDTKTNEELQKKISDSNLTVERYQEIIMVLQNDEQLQLKLQEHLQS